MKGYAGRFIIAAIMLLAASVNGYAGEIYRVRLFFGLSLPGGGAVSLYDWQVFEREQVAGMFDGFNVVDSTGYYKGKPERSKIVTLILDKQDFPKAEKLAQSYARKFHQDSVMMVVVPVSEWRFIEAGQ